MTVEKPTPMSLLRPITTGASGITINQSESLEITRNFLEVRDKSRGQVVIGFGLVSR